MAFVPDTFSLLILFLEQFDGTEDAFLQFLPGSCRAGAGPRMYNAKVQLYGRTVWNPHLPPNVTG